MRVPRVQFPVRRVMVALMIVVAGALAGGGPSSVGQGPAVPHGTTTGRTIPRGERPVFTNASGWEWLVLPRELKIGRTWSQAGGDEGRLFTGYPVIDAEGGALRLFFVQAGPKPVDFLSLRLVVFEESGARHLPEGSDAGEFAARGTPPNSAPWTHLHSAIYTLDPKELVPGKAAYIGVERRTRAAR